MSLPRDERETVIRFDEDSPDAAVWTYSGRIRRMCERAGAIGDDADLHGGMEFRIPKIWIKIRRPKKIAMPGEGTKIRSARLPEQKTDQ